MLSQGSVCRTLSRISSTALRCTTGTEGASSVRGCSSCSPSWMHQWHIRRDARQSLQGTCYVLATAAHWHSGCVLSTALWPFHARCHETSRRASMLSAAGHCMRGHGLIQPTTCMQIHGNEHAGKVRAARAGQHLQQERLHAVAQLAHTGAGSAVQHKVLIQAGPCLPRLITRPGFNSMSSLCVQLRLGSGPRGCGTWAAGTHPAQHALPPAAQPCVLRTRKRRRAPVQHQQAATAHGWCLVSQVLDMVAAAFRPGSST